MLNTTCHWEERFTLKKMRGSCYATLGSSVNRLGDLLDFGQVFKAFGNNQFAQISHIHRQFCKCVQIYHVSSEIIFGQLL